MARVKVEFVGIMPTLYAHCQHCMEVMHQSGLEPYSEQFEEYPEDIKEQYFKIAEMAQRLRFEFKNDIVIDAVDTASPQGIWLSIRKMITKTPCVLINGKKVFNYLPSYEELRERVIQEMGLQIAK